MCTWEKFKIYRIKQIATKIYLRNRVIISAVGGHGTFHARFQLTASHLTRLLQGT